MSATAPGRRRLRRREIIAYVIVLAVVAAGGYALWYRSYYNIWPGQDATARVHWCERDYQNDGGTPETWRQVTAGSRFGVRGFGRYPPLGVPGQQLFAAVFPDARPSSCATVVYLRTGTNRYQSYGLLGGP
ncbi:MAG TPA: hypothetical protein VKU77_33085 [Streptosporangiaceae bacterium]|nr:hypothetical protein [Streptosporangiaceae bacterium]